MNSKIIISYLNDTPVSNNDIQLKFLKNIKTISDKTVFKDENRNILEEILFKQFSTNDLSDNNKRQIINIGLQVIKDKIETSIINKEANILQKINDFTEQEFLKNYSLKLKNLKTQIRVNKIETLELRKKASTISLNELANSINECHNPNQSTNDIDKEVNNLLNGGTLNL
jgi:hypothetical protein